MIKSLKRLFCRHRYKRLIATPGKVLIGPGEYGEQLYRMRCTKCGKTVYGTKREMIELRRR